MKNITINSAMSTVNSQIDLEQMIIDKEYIEYMMKSFNVRDISNIQSSSNFRKSISKIMNTDDRSNEQKDIDTMIVRARKIFDSCNKDIEIVYKATVGCSNYVVRLNEDVYFEYSTNSYTINSLTLVVGEFDISIPLISLSKYYRNHHGNVFSGSTMTPNSQNSVSNIHGEISDFVEDYYDQFGIDS